MMITLSLAVWAVGSVTVRVNVYVPGELIVTCASDGESDVATAPLRLVQPAIPVPLAGVQSYVRPVRPSGSFAVASVITMVIEPPESSSVRSTPAYALGGIGP